MGEPSQELLLRRRRRRDSDPIRTFFFSFLFFPSLEDQPTQKDLMDDTKRRRRRRRVAIVSSKRSFWFFWFLYYTSLCSAVQESCTCCSSWCNPGGPLPTNRSSMTWLNAHCSIDLRVCLPYNRPHNGHIHHQLQPKKKGGKKTSNLKRIFFFVPSFVIVLENKTKRENVECVTFTSWTNDRATPGIR